MVKYAINLPSQAPIHLPPEVWLPLNDLYTQLNMLVQELNRHTDIIQSPNGHYWRVQVDNAGVVSTTDLGTNLP